jgi:hypothetical protein
LKTAKTHGTTGEVVTFLKTSEEAVCNPTSACVWTYSSTVPTITAMTTEFDAATAKWLFKITGVAMRASASSGDTSTLYVGTQLQTMRSHSDTLAVFEVTNVPSLNVTNMYNFYPVGLPANHDKVKNGTNLEPRLMSISPSVGSVGGTQIVASVPGVGITTTGVDLVDQSGSTICESNTVKIPAYGKVTCWTKTSELAAAAFEVKLTYNSTTFECANSDRTQCNYLQASASAMPDITALSKTDTTMVITGTGFLAAASYTATVSYMGINATSAVIDSATQVTATWTNGLPLTAETG